MNAIDWLARSAIRYTEAERIRALKRLFPAAAISRALDSSCSPKRYCRRLPRWFVVWFVVALWFSGADSYRQIFRLLQSNRNSKTPGRSTLCEARRSLGPAPLRRLAEAVIKLQGRPDVPQAFYAGMRLMAIDGFVLDLPNAPANERAFGRPRSGRSPGAFPQARVVTLCETGTHILWKSLIKPIRRGESSMARVLTRFLDSRMLLLGDKNFLAYPLLAKIRERGTQVLMRVKKHLVFAPLKSNKRLPDGSFLAKMYPTSYHRSVDRDGIEVRIIEYTFDDPGRPGAGEKHRLLTTLLSAHEHPAKRLIVLYHERWEEELVIDEFKTHQRERKVLRSATPAGVVQEIYGLLLAHYAIRKLMCEAADFSDVAPRELSFVNTLKILRVRLPECPRSERGIRDWFARLIGEVAAERLEPRRNRVTPRVIRTKMSRWPKKREKHRCFPQPNKCFQRSIVMLN